MYLRPNKSRATATIVFLAAGILVNVLAIYTTYSQLEALRGVEQGIFLTIQEARAMQMMAILVLAINALVSLGTIIAFIMWFRRGYFNLHTKIDNLKYSEGWAAGGWFVPFLNLVRPVEIMSEMSNRTYELLEEEKLAKESNPLKLIIPLWWTLWVGAGIASSVINFSADKNSLDGLIRMNENLLIHYYISFPLALISIIMVRVYSKMEDKLPEIQGSVKKGIITENDLLDS